MRMRVVPLWALVVIAVLRQRTGAGQRIAKRVLVLI